MATCGGSRSRARGEPGPAGRSTFGLWSSNNRPLGGPELLVQVPEQVPHSIPKMNNTERTKVETLSEVHETRIFKVFNDDDDDVVSENVDVGDIHSQVAFWSAEKQLRGEVDAKAIVDTSFVAGHFNIPRG